MTCASDLVTLKIPIVAPSIATISDSPSPNKSLEMTLTLEMKWVFPKIMVPANHPFVHRVFHYKPSILGYPYFRKHPNVLKWLRGCPNDINSWFVFSKSFEVANNKGTLFTVHILPTKTLPIFMFLFCLYFQGYKTGITRITKIWQELGIESSTHSNIIFFVAKPNHLWRRNGAQRTHMFCLKLFFSFEVTYVQTRITMVHTTTCPYLSDLSIYLPSLPSSSHNSKTLVELSTHVGGWTTNPNHKKY